MQELTSCAELNNGVMIPWLGLGVFQSRPGRETRDAVRHALEVGYRHIDTARIYQNEADVGQAVRESGIPRDSIFVTTKLWNEDHGYDATLRAAQESLKRLKMGYIDLYLIHWPVPGTRRETWRAMERLLAEGACRAIGVSNYMVHHLEELLLDASIVPAVNQVELSPFLYPTSLHTLCREKGILLEAYSPLTKGLRLAHPTVVDIARRLERSPAQVLIRWGLEHEVVEIPKSVRRERIEENAKVFDFSLSMEDMSRLDALHEDLHTSWDPSRVP